VPLSRRSGVAFILNTALVGAARDVKEAIQTPVLQYIFSMQIKIKKKLCECTSFQEFAMIQ
jgi:hypothetical protein